MISVLPTDLFFFYTGVACHEQVDPWYFQFSSSSVPLIAQSWNPGLEEVETQGGNKRKWESERQREREKGREREGVLLLFAK